MNADERREGLNKITEKIIGCAYTIASCLGSGFLEKVYENALAHEIRKTGLEFYSNTVSWCNMTILS